MMSSAQLEILPLEDLIQVPEDARPGPGPDARPSALRQQAAERLAAHRQKRGRQGHSAAHVRTERERPEGKNKIAALVAERYAHSPSYRAFLAEEAQKAIRQAAAAAEVAARNAEAVANAQQELLAELELWTAPQEFSAETAITIKPGTPAVELDSLAPVIGKPANTSSAHSPKAPKTRHSKPENPAQITPQSPVREVSTAGLTVRLYEDLGRPVLPAIPASSVLRRSGDKAFPNSQEDLEEALALEDEIAFRQTPVFDDYRDFGGSVEPIAANLVEFPRQLVAAKKVRPRLAEGPLREEGARSPQLRIFEVDPEQISNTPEPASAAPEWSSIRLEAHSLIGPAIYREAEANAILPSLLPPQTARMSLRMMAVGVDLTLVLIASVAFVTAAAYITGEVPSGIPAVTAAGGIVAALYLIYQALFFTFNEQTPGMRYARIGLCTMSDENPSRSAMRKRIVATLVAACPLGIGLLWMFLDDDRLGWHDRISQMYQRAY